MSSSVLNAETLIKSAEYSTGLSDWHFDDENILTPLETLIESINTEANLNNPGQIRANLTLRRLLENRLKLTKDRHTFPDAFKSIIEKPVFIMGLGRSGTTLLHRLMSQHQIWRAPKMWELMYPSPPPGYHFESDQQRIETVCRQLESLNGRSNEYHQLDAQAAEECFGIFQHSFCCPSFAHYWNIPSYVMYLQTVNMLPVYQLHKNVLQLMQHSALEKRWLLKSPIHSLYIDQILATYPDAIFIHVHRDPAEIIGSTLSRNLFHLNSFSDKSYSLDKMGQQILIYFSAIAFNLMSIRQSPIINSHFIDVNYKELIANPLNALASIYNLLDEECDLKVSQDWQQWLLNNPKGKHGRHEYSLTDFGLNKEEIDDIFYTYKKSYKL